MFVKLLICSTLLCLAVADVKDLSRMYLPPTPEVAVPKSDLIVKTFPGVVDVTKNEIVANDMQVESLEPFAKDAARDTAYGYNGLPGGFPGFPGQGFPGQGFPGQGFPGPGFPPQGFPGQGFPGFPPGFVNPGFGPPGFPGQGFPLQQGPPQGFPGIGFPGQGFPGQGFPGQGFPIQTFPTPQFYPPQQGFVNPGVYYSSEQLKKEEREDGDDKKLRLRVVSSDTQYDAENGGYLYKKPTVSF